ATNCPNSYKRPVSGEPRPSACFRANPSEAEDHRSRSPAQECHSSSNQCGKSLEESAACHPRASYRRHREPCGKENCARDKHCNRHIAGVCAQSLSCWLICKARTTDAASPLSDLFPDELQLLFRFFDAGGDVRGLAGVYVEAVAAAEHVELHAEDRQG